MKKLALLIHREENPKQKGPLEQSRKGWDVF